MADEITFRTSVGGYKKDDVLEYMEGMEDKIFSIQKGHEAETASYQAKIRELEAILKQETANSLQLAEQQTGELKALKTEAENSRAENEKLLAQVEELTEKLKAVSQECSKAKKERHILKEKLGREILRLRAENKMLTKKLEEAQTKPSPKTDYETVRSIVSEVQYKIAEYVNIINKTQQSLADTYQDMNTIKKKIASEIKKEEEQKEN